MKLLSKSNSKLKKENIMSFGLPSGSTCPGAGECKKICYAAKGCYRFKNVKATQQARFTVTQQDSFIDLINSELAAMRKKPTAIRIHDSGDFYSQEYLDKWVRIAEYNPTITFYAYTKSLHLDFSKRPENMLIIGSKGSIYDDVAEYWKQVNTTATVIKSPDEVDVNNQVNCSESDLKAIQAAVDGKAIVLIKH